MASKPLYKIRNWSEVFEVAQSRKQPREMSWVPMPTRMDGKRYRKIAQREDGAAVLGCWLVMVEIAARRPLDRRGYLEDSDGPMGPEDLAFSSGIQKEAFENAIKVLCQKGIEWLITETLPEQPAALDQNGLQNNTRQNNTRHNNGAFEVDCKRFIAEYPKEVSDYEAQILLSTVLTQEQQDLLFANLELYRQTDQWAVRKIYPSAKNWLSEGRWKVPPKSGAASRMPAPQKAYQCGECGDTGEVVLMDEHDEYVKQPCPKCKGKAAA